MDVSQGQVDVMRSTLNRQDWLGGRLNLQNSTVSTNCSGIILKYSQFT